MLRSICSFSKIRPKCIAFQFSSLTREQQREMARRTNALLNSEKEAHEIVFQRVGNILKSMADGQITKVLQLYPESKDIIGELGRVRNFEFTGLSAYPENKQIEHNSKSKFARIDYVDFDTCPRIPHDTETFNFVLNLLPFTSKAPQAKNPYIGVVNPEELLRVCNDRGYVLFGAPEKFWEHWDMTNQLQHLDSGVFMVMQWLKFNPIRINEHGGIIDNDRDIVILRDETDDTPYEQYTLAVVQKRVGEGEDLAGNMITRHGGK